MIVVIMPSGHRDTPLTVINNKTISVSCFGWLGRLLLLVLLLFHLRLNEALAVLDGPEHSGIAPRCDLFWVFLVRVETS